MTKIKFSTSQFLAALALAAAIGLMAQATNICPASALEAPETSEQETVPDHVSSQEELVAALADSTIATITVDADFATTSNVVVSRDVTIDLGGHTITNGNNNANLLRITQGKVTIKNGTLKTTGSGGSTVVLTGSTNPDDAAYTIVTVESDVLLQVPANDEYAYGAFIGHNNHHAYGAKLIFNGTIEGGEGLYINGYVQDKTGNIAQVIVGDSAKMTVDDFGIYAAGYAQWTVGAAQINAGSNAPAARATTINGTGVGVKAGAMTFNGTTIATHGTGIAAGEASGSIQGNGAVFQIENRNGYGKDIELTINGGNYTSDDNAVFVQYGSGEQALKSLKITGGNFQAAEGKSVFDIPAVSNSLVAISGGTFSSDVTSFIADDKELSKDANGNWVVGNVSPVVPGDDPATDPTDPDDEDKVEIPNTGVISRALATNAVASVSLVVSMFVAAGIFYNRFKIYRRAAEYIPNPSVNRIKRK